MNAAKLERQREKKRAKDRRKQHLTDRKTQYQQLARSGVTLPVAVQQLESFLSSVKQQNATFKDTMSHTMTLSAAALMLAGGGGGTHSLKSVTATVPVLDPSNPTRVLEERSVSMKLDSMQEKRLEELEAQIALIKAFVHSKSGATGPTNNNAKGTVSSTDDDSDSEDSEDGEGGNNKRRRSDDDADDDEDDNNGRGPMQDRMVVRLQLPVEGSAGAGRGKPAAAASSTSWGKFFALQQQVAESAPVVPSVPTPAAPLAASTTPTGMFIPAAVRRALQAAAQAPKAEPLPASTSGSNTGDPDLDALLDAAGDD